MAVKGIYTLLQLNPGEGETLEVKHCPDSVPSMSLITIGYSYEPEGADFDSVIVMSEDHARLVAQAILKALGPK